MKEELRKLIDEEKWQEVSLLVGEHGEDFSEDELRELEAAYRSQFGAKELDENELKKISGGTAFTTGNSTAPKAGNIHWHCVDVSVHTDCHDSVAQTSSCWFDDACFLVLHHYGDDGWIGGLASDYDE